MTRLLTLALVATMFTACSDNSTNTDAVGENNGTNNGTNNGANNGDCEPSAEVRDGVDNDCDGATDEDADNCCTPGDTQACGAGVGACAQGTNTCTSDRSWGPCVDDGGSAVLQPGEQAETCDDVDNDCDGEVDEDFGVGEACSDGVGACAADGIISCVGGEPVCDAVAGEPARGPTSAAMASWAVSARARCCRPRRSATVGTTTA